MNVQTITTPSIARLNRLIDVVTELRGVYPDMTLNQVAVLLTVAANPGISQSEIMEQTGLADSSASRIVAILSSYGNRGTGPYHLVELVPSENDRRFKTLHLTKKGRALIEKLLTILGQGR